MVNGHSIASKILSGVREVKIIFHNTKALFVVKQKLIRMFNDF